MSTAGRRLVDRWGSEAGKLLAEEAVARLISNRSLDGLDLEEHKGRIDLRGLPLPAPRRIKRFEAAGWFVEQLGDLLRFRDVQLTGLDLSGAQLQSLRFSRASIDDCCFDRARCGDWRLWGTVVRDSSFSGADLRGAAVGTWDENRRNEWRNVSFKKADFRVGASQAALYEDCDFSGAKLANVFFRQCQFVRCRFSGKMFEVVFDGRDIPGSASQACVIDVDFSEATFEYVEFLGMLLNRATFPPDPDVRLVRRYRCVVEQVLAALAEDESHEARMLEADLEGRLEMMRADVEDNIFNRRDYENFGHDLASLATTLFARAEVECAG